MEAVECGAAALGIILGYYGKYIPLAKLRADCGVSRDGVTAINMIKVGRIYGMISKGFKKDITELYDLKLPFIVFWDFGHFLVVEGFSKKKIYLNDPAEGPRTVTYEDFGKSYTGIALTFEPGPDFVKSGAPPSLFQSLKKRFEGSSVALTYVTFVGVALVIPGLVVPIFTKIFIDDYLINQYTDWINPLLFSMAIALILTAALTYLQQKYLLRLDTKISLSTSGKFFWHVLRLPVDFFTQRYAGDVGSRVQLNDTVADLLSGQLSSSILSLVTIIFYAALMFYYDVVLTTVGIIIAILNIVALKYISRKRKDLNKRMLTEQYKLIGTSMSGIESIETLKASGAESDFFNRWAGFQAKMVNAQQSLGVYTQILNTVPPFLNLINAAVILGLGSLRVMEGYLTMGELVAFQILMASFIAPINQLVSLGSTLQQIEGDIDKLDDVTTNEIDTDAFKPGEELIYVKPLDTGKVKLEGYLELKNVTFGYNKLSDPLIEDLSVSLKPGSRIALVGTSGSGKSTIAKLVCGLYYPWSGEILLDGKIRDDIPRDIITNSIAMVDQDISLFSGTIRENLTMWDSTISDEDIIQAAKDACIHDVIAARPGGYDSMISEGGDNFSGGQNQRIEIARTLVVNPSILVMDEATSSLDPTTEKIIDDNVRRRGCTIFVIAHRLSTIRDADEIIVLEYGKVVQRGTHDELVKVEGPYLNLIKME